MATPNTFETNQYNSKLRDITILIAHVNGITLSAELQTYLLDKNLVSIDVNGMLAEIKTAKGLNLPNFQQYLDAGINLTDMVPDNPATVSALTDLSAAAKLRSGDARYIKYSPTGWTVNDAGATMLDDAKVTLTAKQLALYNAVKALHAQLIDNKVSGYEFKRVLSEDVVGFNGTAFLESEVIDNIKNFK